ncbi:MAG: hypothetical protein ACYDH5_15040 [Acidimicrobiales bacterium]
MDVVEESLVVGAAVVGVVEVVEEGAVVSGLDVAVVDVGGDPEERTCV